VSGGGRYCASVSLCLVFPLLLAFPFPPLSLGALQLAVGSRPSPSGRVTARPSRPASKLQRSVTSPGPVSEGRAAPVRPTLLLAPHPSPTLLRQRVMVPVPVTGLLPTPC
jgi:hypothetical protein